MKRKSKNNKSRIEKLWESLDIAEAEGNTRLVDSLQRQIDEYEGIETMADFERKQKGGRY